LHEEIRVPSARSASTVWPCWIGCPFESKRYTARVGVLRITTFMGAVVGGRVWGA
jgi:hypothetical protein